MAHIPYRANLSAAIFPLSVARAGNSVILPGIDQNFDRRVDPQGASKNVGIPQAVYMQNVIPTAEGYQSVSYIDNSNIPDIAQITMAHEIYCLDNGAEGIVYRGIIVWNQVTELNEATTFPAKVSFDGFNWINVDPFPAKGPKNKLSFFSFVCRGIAYGYIVGDGLRTLYEIELIGGTVKFNSVTMNPGAFFSDELIQGVCSSFNYLIAWSNSTIYWSSTVDVSDFASSLVTGAGQAQPNNTYSRIRFVVASNRGFHIYTDTNVIAATYTGNNRYPWRFAEIKNSNEVPFLTNIYGGTNIEFQFVCETTGQLKLLGSESAEIVAPEVSTLIERERRIDTLNYTTGVLSTKIVETPGFTERPVHMFANRYLLISWSYIGRTSPTNPDALPGTLVEGLPQYEYVIWYDRLLQRYGKLKITHTHIMVIKERLLFLDAVAKKTYNLNFDVTQSGGLVSPRVYQPAQGALVLGRFAHSRGDRIELHTLRLESTLLLIDDQDFQVKILPSEDGTNRQAAITPDEVLTANYVREYETRTETRNFMLLIQGAFDLNTVEMEYTVGGEW